MVVHVVGDLETEVPPDVVVDQADVVGQHGDLGVEVDHLVDLHEVEVLVGDHDVVVDLHVDHP